MDISKKILPQISRFFSAKKVQRQLDSAISIAVSLSCLGIFALNATQANGPFKPGELPGIITAPFSPSEHFALASKFKSIQDDIKKENEMIFVQDLMNLNSNVLGDSTEISETIHSWNEEPKQLEDRFVFWNTILSNHPDYRDAYLQAAYIAKRLHKYATGTDLLERAKKLDPSLE